MPGTRREERIRDQWPRKPRELHRRSRTQLPSRCVQRHGHVNRSGDAGTKGNRPFLAGKPLAAATEIVRRVDRDGEAFLRFFLGPDGTTRIRFVEPDQVATPADMARDPSASLGIQTDADDVETVLGYYIDGEFV